MNRTKENAPLEAATSKSAKVEHIQRQDTTNQARTQGPLYPNLWAEAQYNAKPWAMANKINATEEMMVKIIWGKEPLHAEEAVTLARYLGRPLNYLLSPILTRTDPKDARQREKFQKAVEELGNLLEALGPDPDHAYQWAYQTFRQALVEPVTMAQYLQALDWMKFAKSTVQAEKTKRR